MFGMFGVSLLLVVAIAVEGRQLPMASHPIIQSKLIITSQNMITAQQHHKTSQHHNSALLHIEGVTSILHSDYHYASICSGYWVLELRFDVVVVCYVHPVPS